MKKHFNTIVTVISCVLVIVCLFKISSLSGEVNSLRNSLYNSVDTIQGRIDGISYNVSESLEEQTSLLASWNWEFGTFNRDDFTAELICSVSPKEYSSETEAYIISGDKEYPMELTTPGEFTVALEVPVFEEAVIQRVVFKEGGTVRTEDLSWHTSARGEFLPYFYADFYGTTSSTDENGMFTMNGTIDVNADCSIPFEIASMTLVEKLNGEVVSTIDLPVNTDHDTVIGAETTSPPNTAVSQFSVNNSNYYNTYVMDKEYYLPADSVHELYVVMVDGYGLHYENIVSSWTTDENGLVDVSQKETAHMESDIYDSDGSLVYEVQYW